MSRAGSERIDGAGRKERAMADWTVVVDTAACIGCGTCCEEAPESFRIDSEDVAHFIHPPGDDDEAILSAAQGCPVDAITITDDETGDQLWPEV